MSSGKKGSSVLYNKLICIYISMLKNILFSIIKLIQQFTFTFFVRKSNKIVNSSTDAVAASLSANVTSSLSDSHFNAPTYAFYSDAACSTALTGNINPTEAAYLLVTVSLNSVPVTDVLNDSFTITITATPQEVTSP